MQPQPTPATQTAKSSRMSLGAVSRGRLKKPVRVLLYGTEGIGKSTFAARAPSPIFLCAEDGTSELDVARFPEPSRWSEVFDAVATLTNDAHEYKTLVIDTLDWLEPMNWAHVCDKPDAKGKRHENIDSFGYGKGFNAALDEWRRLVGAIERMRRAREMNVIMLAHSWIKTFKNPEGDDFDRYMLKLNEKAGGFLKEWPDAVLFSKYETFTHESNGKAKGISTGARMIHTRQCAAWDAKNRYDLPETLPLDWDAFAEAVASHQPADPEKLKAKIAEQIAAITNEKTRAKVAASVAAADNDSAELARIADKLSALINAQENGQ